MDEAYALLEGVPLVAATRAFGEPHTRSTAEGCALLEGVPLVAASRLASNVSEHRE